MSAHPIIGIANLDTLFKVVTARSHCFKGTFFPFIINKMWGNSWRPYECLAPQQPYNQWFSHLVMNLA